MENTNCNGIFVSYIRNYSFLAGRIYDYLENKGYDPFMDVYKMPQGYFAEEIKQKIRECPYFLLVLGKDCFADIDKHSVFVDEIKTAFECKAPNEILIIAEDGFIFPSVLPEEIKDLPSHHVDFVSHKDFKVSMERLVRNIEFSKISKAINWHEHALMNTNAVLGSRTAIERGIGSLENRFGKELIDAVSNNQPYEGPQIIRKIRMSCYAASIVFNPARDMVDDRAFDNGKLFNTLAELLKDSEFSLEIIINAPDSNGAQEAIRNNMLGNSALEECQEAIFYSAYAGITRLIEEDPAFKAAYENKRFRFYLSDIVMCGAFFEIQYKDGYTDRDHIKYDLYSYGLASNMDRRCLLVFRKNDPDDYTFLESTYDYIKNHRYKQSVIKENHEAWIARWEEIKEDL